MLALLVNPNPPPLETFTTPLSYRFEPELQGTQPGHVPEGFRNSPYFVRRRNNIVGLVMKGEAGQ